LSELQIVNDRINFYIKQCQKQNLLVDEILPVGLTFILWSIKGW